MNLLFRQKYLTLPTLLVVALITVGCTCPNPKAITTVTLSTAYADFTACTAAIPTKCASTTVPATNAACNAYCAAGGGLKTCIGKSAITTKFAGACFPVDATPIDYHFNCSAVFNCSCL